MTDNNYLQEELKKTKIAYQEALESSRTKAGFLGRIAHEIRSPLGSLMGLHQLIINDLCESQEEEKEFIGEAYEYAKKLMAIIDQLIEVSKLEAGKLNLESEKVCLAELLKNIYLIIDLPARNKNLQLEFEEIPENLWLQTDKVKLQNSLMFLLEVAIDYSERGKIHLKVRNDEENLRIEITLPLYHQPLSENVDLINSPVDELKQFNNLPQLSSGIKLMLVENLLTFMGGVLTLEVGDDEVMQWQISLPSEIVVTNP